MLSRSTPIIEQSLRGLHPQSIEDRARILSLLERARVAAMPFHRGLNARVDLETAFVDEVSDASLVLRAGNFDRRSMNGQVFLNFSCDGRPYFFATRRAGPFEGDRLEVEVPKAIYYRERRDRTRRVPDPSVGDPCQVSVEGLGDGVRRAEVQDVSPSGLGLLVRGPAAPAKPGMVTLHYLDGADRGRDAQLELRSSTPVPDRVGWTRIGLVRTDARVPKPIAVERRDSIAGAGPAAGHCPVWPRR